MKVLIPTIFAVSFLFLLGVNQGAFAVGGTISDEASCNAIGGVWNGGTSTCSFAGSLTVGSGETLTISPGITLDVFRLFVNAGGVVNNQGTITNVGISNFISNGGTINNFNTITSSGISNSGTIINDGNISSLGILLNNGLIEQNNANLVNDGTINNFGTINNDPDGNSGNIFNNNIFNNQCGAVYSGDLPIGNPINFIPCPPPPDNEQVIGGEIIPISSTALLLAGAQTSAFWMIPLLLAVAGIATLYIKKKQN